MIKLNPGALAKTVSMRSVDPEFESWHLDLFFRRTWRFKIDPRLQAQKIIQLKKIQPYLSTRLEAHDYDCLVSIICLAVPSINHSNIKNEKILENAENRTRVSAMRSAKNLTLFLISQIGALIFVMPPTPTNGLARILSQSPKPGLGIELASALFHLFWGTLIQDPLPTELKRMR